MTITETSFKYIQKITSLNLSLNNLRKINESQFELLTELQYLNLSNNKIENLSELSFNNLQNILVLDISYNRLLTLNNAINSLHNLNKLMLNNNYQLSDNLHIVTNSYLIHLQMVNVSLKTVPKSIMTHSVVNLNISSNLLESLTNEDFDSVPLLRILDVSRNQIKVIESDALGRLELLEELYFSHNFIANVAPNLTPTLRIADFSYNFISIIALLNLEKLEILDLSWNPIEKLPENLLINLKNLKTLKLAGLRTNQSLIPVPDSNSITSLDLSSSPSLAQEFLQNEAIQIAYKSITDLNLAFNSIEQLPSTISFEYLSELTCLKLDGNEILCDSLTNWTELIKWLEVRALNKMQIQCLITEAHKSKLIPLIEFYNSISLPIVLKHEKTNNRNFQFLQFFIVFAMFSTLIISLVLIFFGKKWIDYSKSQDTEPKIQLTDFQELW